MRVIDSGEVEAEIKETGKSYNKIDNVQKINWPDMVFGPVNLWSLPPAWFIYRKHSDKGFV